MAAVVARRPILWGASWLIVLGLVLAFAGAAVARLDTTIAAQRVAQPAPDFQLIPTTGKPVTLGSLRGRAVVVTFWASWCSDCWQGAPIIEETWREERGTGVAFLGVAVDDTEHNLLGFLKKVRPTFPTGHDTGGAIAHAYGIVDLPTTVFIGRDGTIASRHVGIMSQYELRGYLNALAG